MELWSLFLRAQVETDGKCHCFELTWRRGGPLGPDVCEVEWTSPQETQLRLPGSLWAGLLLCWWQRVLAAVVLPC